MKTLKEITALLPHQPPFRFVDNVTEYIPTKELCATFKPIDCKSTFGDSDEVPFTILGEGLAQAAVIFTQMESEPLTESDVPMLGNMEASYFGRVLWEDKITYKIKPYRILGRQAILYGKLFGSNGELVLSAKLSVAVRNSPSKN
ncbi:FabA-like domain protein [Bacillus infantis]|uniref:FabA-like domain protein n=1 Tax=Bacillus infantis TaxID=324767 RepID=A0A5D4SFT4_9BACI|nr:FabA-like domain protein [Bacillus infantis]TYS60656.1 FabA-like domain protein [Bacillus infantis]